MVLEQTVSGLIKALRANKNDEARVVQQALDETRREIQSSDIDLKAEAILKLVYLEMLGYSISFAAFAIVECMTSTKPHIKSIGYLAASQCFDRETEVAVLVVNLVKKDLLSPPSPTFSSSPNALTVAHLTSTLSSVSLLLTPSLARDLGPDLLSLLTHTRPLVRRQATLILWRILHSWPGVQELTTGREERGEDPWIERLRERLSDEDMGVVGSAVNVICEAARKDARKYLPLAPELFGLLTASTNNWMLIKIIKLFAVLTREEPRLVKKLVPPLTELIETTPAMSLLYECIQTSIVGGMLNGAEGEQLARTCVQKLGSFLEDLDQNLRYIALVALVKIAPTHPHLISTHHDTILNCVDDPDLSIRMRALDLVEVMADRQNLQAIVRRLSSHLRPTAAPPSAAASLLRAQQSSASATQSAPTPPVVSAAYRASVISLILRMCCSATYANVSNFAWLIDTLVEMTYISRTLQSEPTPAGLARLGRQLRDQLIDVVARVRQIRPYAARKMAALLQDEELLDEGEASDAAEVLGAAAWICGEYCRDLEDPRPVIASLFGSSTTSTLPPRILAIYIHNGVKITASWLSALSESWDESAVEQIKSITSALESQLAQCSKSTDAELQERAAELGGLLQLVRQGLDLPRDLIETEPSDSNDADDSNGFATSRRHPPASLKLLEPLFFSHELNPVNPKAQSLVAPPEGLDLDTALHAGAWAEFDGEAAEPPAEVDDYGRPIRKFTSGGGDEAISTKDKKKKKDKSGSKKSRKRTPAESDLQTFDPLYDDPYRVGQSQANSYHGGATASDGEEVDSIPIVKLDLDLRSPSPRVPTPPPREPTPPPMFVDVDGELPPTAAAAAAAPRTATKSPPAQESAAQEQAPLLQEEESKPNAVATEKAAVKVVKKKKKKAAAGDGAGKSPAGGKSRKSRAVVDLPGGD